MCIRRRSLRQGGRRVPRKCVAAARFERVEALSQRSSCRHRLLPHLHEALHMALPALPFDNLQPHLPSRATAVIDGRTTYPVLGQISLSIVVRWPRVRFARQQVVRRLILRANWKLAKIVCCVQIAKGPPCNHTVGLRRRASSRRVLWSRDRRALASDFG